MFNDSNGSGSRSKNVSLFVKSGLTISKFNDSLLTTDVYGNTLLAEGSLFNVKSCVLIPLIVPSLVGFPNGFVEINTEFKTNMNCSNQSGLLTSFHRIVLLDKFVPLLSIIGSVVDS